MVRLGPEACSRPVHCASLDRLLVLSELQLSLFFFFLAYEGIELLGCKAPLLTLWKSELLAVKIYNQQLERGCTVDTCKKGLRL